MSQISYKLRTSESVCEGHPDKLADQISDAILDAHLAVDPGSRCAVETLVTDGLIVLAGEVKSGAKINFEEVARQVALEVGYTSEELGLDAQNCQLVARIQRQSREIDEGVKGGGAGDQGVMFGYATSESPSLMPLPIAIAHSLTRRATQLRRERPELGLRPDGKAQATLAYEGSRPLRLKTVVVSLQHDAGLAGEMESLVRDLVVGPVLGGFPGLDSSAFDLYVNPTGSFVQGGPATDTGLTGRKIVVDTYGGAAPHGGGAFSGKDATKVDRSAAYMARLAAKTLVAEGLVERALVSVAYAIGREEPVMVELEQAEGSPEGVCEARERLQSFDFRPRAIIETLGLRNPIFRATAKNGHFGNPEFPWE